ncbi:hypothetical protein ET495_05720 [Xylanimonas allomyrinae]|uniref:ATP-grasp domain-containing protein n=1 Tax=Xylanimonas allomyrinae TaxID=2509459 RepID=A0A4P6ER54_9MICO|nr:hypothetical protein [Xylanimonas allomyrinae]QAY62827.1 hypothetical protein ET495_05720 [Xylanimonas allomyrinae]
MPTSPLAVRPVIVGPDIGVYALARAFHERYGARSTVVALAEPGPIASSAIIDLVICQSLASDDVIETLVSVAAAHTGPEQLIALTNMDSVVNVLAHRRTELEAAGYLVPLASGELVDRLGDKAEFIQICDSLGIATPATVVQDFAEADSPGWTPLPVHFPFPVIAKPASSADYYGVVFPGKAKIYELTEQSQLDSLYESLRAAGFRGRFLVQDTVPGDDTEMRSVTTYTDGAGRVTLRAAARVLLEEHTPITRGNPTAMIVEDIPDLVDAAVRINEATGWRGFANFDVKRDPRDGVFRFFEQNPRIGRNNYYVTAGGANVAEVLVDDVVRGLSREPVTARTEVLYATVPHLLLRRYLLDPALRARAVALMRSGRTVHPLRYARDFGLKRRVYALAQAVNYWRKYRRYLPMDELRRLHEQSASRPRAAR